MEKLQSAKTRLRTEEIWTEVRDVVWEVMVKTISKKKKWKKAEEGLQIAKEGRDVKGKEEKERYIHLNAEFQWIEEIRKPS